MAKKGKKSKKKKKVVYFDSEAFFDEYRDKPYSKGNKPVQEVIYLPEQIVIDQFVEEEEEIDPYIHIFDHKINENAENKR